MIALSHRLAFFSLIVFSFGIFTSVSISALGHILLLLPTIYFSYQFFKKEKIRLSLSHLALIGLSVTIVLSVVFNWSEIEKPLRNLSKVKYFLFGAFGIFAYYELSKNYLNTKRMKILLWIFLISTSVATISGLVGLFSGFNPLKFKNACHESRACGLYGMYMTYGYGISLFASLMACLTLYRKKIADLMSGKWIIVFFIISLSGLYFSFARGGWIGFLASIPFLWIKKDKKLFLKIVLISLLGFGSILGISKTVQNMFFNRVSSDTTRIAFFKSAIKAFEEKPLLGYGYRNFEPNMTKIKKKYNIEFPHHGGHAHNNLLEHLASTGFIGFFFTIAFFMFWFWEAFKSQGIISDITLPFVVNFLVSGLFQYTFGDGENLFLIFLVYMIFQVSQLNQKNSDKVPIP